MIGPSITLCFSFSTKTCSRWLDHARLTWTGYAYSAQWLDLRAQWHMLIPKSDCSFPRYLWYLEGYRQCCREWVGKYCYPFVPARLSTCVWAHCQYDVFIGKKRGEFSTLPTYHSSSHCSSIGSFCSIFQVPQPSIFLLLLLIYIPFCDSMTFQCLQNARYMPLLEPKDFGHCPSDNLSRPVRFSMKNRWILSKLRMILYSWVPMQIIHLTMDRHDDSLSF